MFGDVGVPDVLASKEVQVALSPITTPEATEDAVLAMSADDNDGGKTAPAALHYLPGKYRDHLKEVSQVLKKIDDDVIMMHRKIQFESGSSQRDDARSAFRLM